jgi:multiple sugar transport system substrate-binding protein
MSKKSSRDCGFDGSSTQLTLRAAGLHRRELLKAGLAASAFAVGFSVSPVRGQAKKFAGVTISGAAFQSTYHEYLKSYLPEFEADSGMKVDFQLQAFPVYNQRMDLELSTKGSAYDFCNLTFIYSGRWVGANWFTPLDGFVKDTNKTAPDWDAEDFVSGTVQHLKNAKGEIFAFPWEAGGMLMAASRGDLIEKAGLQMPKTFADLMKVCEATNNQEGVAAFVADRLHHWNWIPYLMGFGGQMFRSPPDDLMPTFDTAEAAEAAEWYARLLADFSPQGVLSFSDDQAMRAQMSGRANIRTQAITWITPLVGHAESKVAKTTRYSLMPAGPKGNYPGSNSHGLGIPAGAKNKDAAWAFISWALSKQMINRIVKEKAYGAVCRRSVITSEQFTKSLTLNGDSVAPLFLQVLELGGKTGHMKYRTVPVFPQVGDKINKAIERIVTKQQNAKAALAQAKEEAISDLKKAGINL